MSLIPAPVTVIIPVHNGAATIERAIESALPEASTIIVINDASTDGTADILLNYSQNRRVYFLNTQGGFPSGVCNARNIGIERARDGLIIPLDADDEFIPGGIRAMCKMFRPGTFIVPGWIEDGVHKTPPPVAMLDRKEIGFATMLFHKDDWKRAGGYDPDFNMGAEDRAFMLSLRKIKVSPTIITDAVYIRHTDGGNGRSLAARSRITAINLLMKEKSLVK